jgi:biopolymer transport protein TolR
MRADGAIFMNLGMSDAEDEGTRVTVYSLEDQAAKVLRARPDVPVYVKADHSLDYGKVVTVMTVLQKAGAESVGLITDPPDLSRG